MPFKLNPFVEHFFLIQKPGLLRHRATSTVSWIFYVISPHTLILLITPAWYF